MIVKITVWDKAEPGEAYTHIRQVTPNNDAQGTYFEATYKGRDTNESAVMSEDVVAVVAAGIASGMLDHIGGDLFKFSSANKYSRLDCKWFVEALEPFFGP